MKGITYQGTQKLELLEVKDPILQASDDAIIRVELAGICGSDLHVYNGREAGIDKGTVMGHEFMGQIVETGPDISQLKTDDWVISPFFSSCGSCFFCENDLSCRCDHGELFGWKESGVGLEGTQTEYLRVPMANHTLKHLREGIDAEHGLMLGDILPTAFYCVDMAKPIPGRPYAVIGCGPVGQLIIMALRARGIDTIYAFDLSEERRNRAEELGAIGLDPNISDDLSKVFEHTEGRGVEAVLEAVGSPSAQKLAYDLVRKGGIISVVGVHNEPHFSFAPVDLYNKNLTYRTGRCPVENYMPEIEKLIVSGMDFRSIISHRISLEEGVEAYQKFNDRHPDYSKVLIRPFM